jgi:hypothetical protein
MTILVAFVNAKVIVKLGVGNDAIIILVILDLSCVSHVHPRTASAAAVGGDSNSERTGKEGKASA